MKQTECLIQSDSFVENCSAHLWKDMLHEVNLPLQILFSKFMSSRENHSLLVTWIAPSDASSQFISNVSTMAVSFMADLPNSLTRPKPGPSLSA